MISVELSAFSAVLPQLEKRNGITAKPISKVLRFIFIALMKNTNVRRSEGFNKGAE